MKNWLNRFFQREEMDGDGRCATYLVRWTLLKWWGGRGLYLHHFVGDDWSLDLHDHPKRFVSIGLLGRYVEWTPAPMNERPTGRWEVATDTGGEMIRVRWSERDAAGRWFYCRHYPNTGWGRNACERNAERMNEADDVPWAMASFQPAPAMRARTFSAPWVRSFSAQHRHRISLIDGRPCWTLVIVLKTVRPWGFWHAGVWVPWRKYVNSKTATLMKSCGD